MWACCYKTYDAVYYKKTRKSDVCTVIRAHVYGVVNSLSLGEAPLHFRIHLLPASPPNRECVCCLG